MNGAFESELRKRLGAEIERLRSILEAPGTIQKYSDYRHIVGQVVALRRVVDSYCDDINKLINER